MNMQKIHTEKAPAAIGPYSQGIQANGMIYVSGCLPIDMSTGVLSTEDIATQTRHCMKNVAAILEAAGSSLDRVVKTTIFIKDLDNFAAVNAAYGEFFPGMAPARACVQVAALPKNAEIEIEAIALA